MSKRTFVYGDLHKPFVDLNKLEDAHAVCEDFNPHHIVQIGDLYDFFAFSKWSGSKNVMRPRDEITLGRQMAEDFWKKIKKFSPKSKKYQMMGNHDERLFKRMYERWPEIEGFIDTRLLWEFRGVETIYRQRNELFIDDICFLHGHYGRVGQHLRFNMMSTVIGHTHKGYTHFMRVKDKIIWEANAGHLADYDSTPLSYTSQRKINQCTHGCLLIEDNVPTFMPL